MEQAFISVSPMQWGSLRDIEDTPPLNTADHDCLREVYEVLKRHGKADRFGLTLAHKHFDMRENETLLEYCDPVSRKLTIEVVSKDCQALSQSVQTSWMLREGEDHQVITECYNSCWTDVHGNHNRTHRQG